MRNFLTVAEKRTASRYVQPAFVRPEGLDHIGGFKIYIFCKVGKMDVLVVMRLLDYQLGAFGKGLYHRLSRLNAVLLRLVIFRQNYAVALFNASAYRNRL